MPYSADLRTGYGYFTMNVSWFWEYLSEQYEEIKINPIGITDEEIKNNNKMYDDMLEKVIEDAFDKYITYVVFDKPKGIQNEDIDFYDDPFGYAYDKMIEFIKKYPRIYEIKRIDGYEDDE
jgi:hypothetical protein